MIKQPSSSPRRGLGTLGGILIGVGGTFLVLLLIALFSFLMMGRCPMCDWMGPRDGMMDNRMMDDGITGRDDE